MSSEYEKSGVDYGRLDLIKRLAVAAAATTDDLAASNDGFDVFGSTRGEPAFCFTVGTQTLALVVEGLGTKSLIAERVLSETGENYFDAVAKDAVAAIVNDLLCVGALPLVVNAYWSVGDATWYDSEAAEALINGWQSACRESGAVWGGGESPALPDIVAKGAIELAGSAVGAIPQGSRPMTGEAIAEGDRIILVESSGMHTNGASAMRRLAADLPDGYNTSIDSAGTSFGRAILVPTVNYTPLVRRLVEDADCEISYINHITGHGFLKLMRPVGEWRYVIEQLPPVPSLFEFFVRERSLDAAEAYTLFNMGAGLALYVRPDSVAAVLDAAAAVGLNAWDAGRVEPGVRSVAIEPHDVVFDAEAMRLR
jgi:phosphoribosylformylglycinamidine cyclo-ligase